MPEGQKHALSPERMANRDAVEQAEWRRKREEGAARGVGKAAANSEQLKEELDGLLDEIDEVLETNADEFIKAYVQKGGE
jgi:ubiquitin-like protein Pup